MITYIPLNICQTSVMLCFYTNVADKNLVFQNGLLGLKHVAAQKQSCQTKFWLVVFLKKKMTSRKLWVITLWLWGCARTSAIGRHLPKPDLARAKGESSRCISWQLWAWSPVPTPAGTKGGLWLGRACLPICGAAADSGRNSYRSVVGFHAKLLLSRG